MNESAQLAVPVPPRLANFPRDHRGFIVPHFVAWFRDGMQVKAGDGAPDFRVVAPGVMVECVRWRRCWICGQSLGKRQAFVLGPMCVITRVTSEPGSHRDCAEYAMRVCPFLTKPNMRRNPSTYEMPVIDAAGEHSPGNPGIMAMWITDGADPFEVAASDGQPGVLFTVRAPSEVMWWREGRRATPDEVTLGLAMAMPALEAQAAKKGGSAMSELERAAAQALDYLPKE